MRHALVTLLLAGCTRTVFVCADDAACGPDGTCAPSGYCGFPDDDCASGQRYSELAGDGLAGTCVSDVALVDAAPGPVWWDAGWAHRRRITVDTTVELAAGYELGVPIDLAFLVGAGADADAAVRVMVHDGAGWTQRPRTLERGNVDRIWTSFATAMAAGERRELWLYYRSDATSGALDDPEDVFLAYEPWDVFDTDVHAYSAPLPTADGELILAPGSAAYPFDSWFPDRAFDAAVRIPTWGDSLDVAWFFNDADKADYAVVGWESYPSGGMAPHYDHLLGNAWNGALTTAAAGTRYVWSVERSLTGARFLLDHELKYTDSFDEELDPFSGMSPVFDNDTASTIYVDWYRVRRWVDPPPTITVGPEEAAP